MALKPFRAPAQMFFSRSFLPRRRRNAVVQDAQIILDLSRLLGRAYHTTPTGIDRVEFSYALELLARVPDRLCFAAVHPAGGYYGRLDTASVRQFLAFTQAKWQNRDIADPQAIKAAAIRHLFALRPRAVPPLSANRVYVQASPHHLEKTAFVRQILKSEHAHFVNLVHDVIPLTHPEFARPNGATEHARRVETISELADGIIGNSAATIAALLPHLKDRPGRAIRTAHLGCEWSDVPPVNSNVSADRPYFVCVGTIEPRKNHLLLLNVWRRLVERFGEGAPKLVMVGRRGWENENVIDILERSTVLSGHVVEEADMSDRKLAELLSGARAMLLPSFAEGYGMPVAEALAAGVPVIASDIQSLREVGGDVPEYLDPIDGLGWYDMIADYARSDSSARARQFDRLLGWSPTFWSDHIDIVLDVVRTVSDAASGRPGGR